MNPSTVEGSPGVDPAALLTWVVLYVGSHEEDRKALSALLRDRQLPFRILTAESVPDALELRTQVPCDAFLLDTRVEPENAVRLLSQNPYIPAVCMVPAGDVTNAVRFMKAGAADIVEKNGEPLRPEALVATLKQVLERTRARHALGESEDRFRSAFEHAAIGIALIHPEGRWLRVNQSMCSIVGFSQVEMLCKTVQSVTHPGDLDTEITNMNRLLRGNANVYQMEKRFIHRSGREIWTLAVVSLLRGRGGTPLHFIAQIQDISRRKQDSEHLKAAKEAAERADQAKGEFVARISHELRTPLNGVIGTCSLLLDSNLSPQQRELASTARLSADALLEVINEVLDFSKIEAGKVHVESVPTRIRQLVDEVVGVLSTRAHSSRVELSHLVEEDVPETVLADPAKLRQVLVNLAGNALKFTKTGDVQICVQAGEDRDSLRFEVRDTGIGISEKDLDRLFEAFEQADSSTTRKYGGTGLGLAICRGIVAAMGGHISVKSEQGKGSEFFFTLPLQAVELDPACDPAPEIQGRRIGILHASKKAAESLAGILRHAGAVPEVFEDDPSTWPAQTADELVLVDDLLLDEGTAAAELERRLESGSRLVRLLSGLRIGGSGRFSILPSTYKPVRRVNLLKTIQAALDESRGREEPVGSPPQAVETIAPQPSPPHPIRVLIAEDNPVNQLVLKSNLQSLGIGADCVEDGLAVIESHERNPYDCILMDCHMPELDGYEATRQIRGLPAAAAGVFIVAVTANATASDRAKCREAGMDEYLPKPFTREALREIIEEAWKQAKRSGRAIRGDRTAPHHPRLDPKQMESLRRLGQSTGRDMIAEVAEIFERTTPDLIKHLQASVLAGDLANAKADAHKLKGSCSSAGLPALRELAERTEEEAEHGRVDALAQLAGELSKEAELAVEALRKEAGAT